MELEDKALDLIDEMESDVYLKNFGDRFELWIPARKFSDVNWEEVKYALEQKWIALDANGEYYVTKEGKRQL